ncbi:sodium:solute symporter family protein [Thermodesulfobacteriota bacterium]
MRTLATVDYVIIVSYIAISLVVGLIYTKKASRSVEDFFLSGRSLPWWLVGISMAATNFAIDTPLAITKFVFTNGIAGVWFFWAFAVSALLATFLFSRLWRRAEVLTDAEIIERRYSGRSASFLRLFKGFYFGVLVNCFVMGWVFRALIKIMSGVTDLDTTTIVVVFTVVAFVYTIASGFYGVVITDLAQYIIAFVGSILLAVLAVGEVGGVGVLINSLQAEHAGSGVLNFLPRPSAGDQWMPFSVFLLYICVQWWAYKYSDGGGKHVQRMSAAKNERHATAGTFLFSVLFYAMQVWPWIVTALCSIVVFGRGGDPEMTYPMMMARVLPAGLLGLMVVALLGAFMSTIDTHLNLGASYMINDIYRRFIVKDASEKHYLLMSRVMMLASLLASVGLAMVITSVAGAWKFIMAFTSGAAVTWILRWFWWRLNAWSEVSAMVASGAVTTVLQVAFPDMLFSWRVVTIITLSAVVWISVTFLTPPVEEKKLVEFVNRIRPGSPGWNYIYRKHGIESSGYLKGAVLNWVLGLVTLFGINFGIGNLVLRRPVAGLLLLALAAAAFTVILVRFKQDGSVGCYNIKTH